MLQKFIWSSGGALNNILQEASVLQQQQQQIHQDKMARRMQKGQNESSSTDSDKNKTRLSVSPSAKEKNRTLLEKSVITSPECQFSLQDLEDLDDDLQDYSDDEDDDDEDEEEEDEDEEEEEEEEDEEEEEEEEEDTEEEKGNHVQRVPDSKEHAKRKMFNASSHSPEKRKCLSVSVLPAHQENQDDEEKSSASIPPLVPLAEKKDLGKK